MTGQPVKGPVRAWHFLASNCRLTVYDELGVPRYGDGELVEEGMKLSMDENIAMCMRGFHASRRVHEADVYSSFKNAVLCRVELSGRVLEGRDKLVANERTVVKMLDFVPLVRSWVDSLSWLPGECKKHVHVRLDIDSCSAFSAARNTMVYRPAWDAYEVFKQLNDSIESYCLKAFGEESK